MQSIFRTLINECYIPLNGKTKSYQNTLASEIPQEVLNDSRQNASSWYGAQGHRIFNTQVTLVEEVGPGVELEVGKSFVFNQLQVNSSEANRSWLRFGGYHYTINRAQNIYGVQANLEQPLNQYVSIILQNNYDNQNNNRFSIGLRTNFGGSSAPRSTLESRMVDPIIRHQARQSYGEAEPRRLDFVPGTQFTDIANGWFFSPNGIDPKGNATTQNDCTAENPCNAIDSDTARRIQELDPQANLLFETGNYQVLGVDGARVANLWDGQRVLGRDTGWVNAASDSSRPVIEGGLFWGDADNPNRENAIGYIENMMVTNTNQYVSAARIGGTDAAVIAVGSAGSITANTSSFIAMATTDSTTLTQSFGIFGRQSTLSNNSSTYSRAEGINIYAAGIEGGINTRVIGGTHNAEAITLTGAIDTATSAANGIFSVGLLSVENAVAIGRAIVAIDNVHAEAAGMKAIGNIIATGGSSTAEASAAGDDATAVGISGDIVGVNNMTISATANNTTGDFTTVTATGIDSATDVIVSGSTISVVANNLAGIGDAMATGVQFAGTANTTEITVSGNGTNTKCDGVSSGDESCL